MGFAHKATSKVRFFDIILCANPILNLVFRLELLNQRPGGQGARGRGTGRGAGEQAGGRRACDRLPSGALAQIADYLWEWLKKRFKKLFFFF